MEEMKLIKVEYEIYETTANYIELVGKLLGMSKNDLLEHLVTRFMPLEWEEAADLIVESAFSHTGRLNDEDKNKAIHRAIEYLKNQIK